ncbi:hypothetical protein BCR32DRAFT_293464 [Anaeromyces robustus]|uniref:Dickkopf N-terminal cysteine-rich domain-containing protein n=1 Tax=Anaeromyces robustus TaxID=1754192 RepID=A0A1Y1X5Z6_9FUNG|nr:hypothetical protein BCR32DRAFT_293464 [Anaeromyces robustus]|eukprot:ORX81085.1 hypothetical protein BCR32DRAFT_293464 [Anaeromyces robustus]
MTVNNFPRYLSCFFYLLFILPVLTYSDITLEKISSLKSISCEEDIDCPNSLSCKNNFCQYPIHYCLGQDLCIEENIKNHIYYSYQNNNTKDSNNNNDDDNGNKNNLSQTNKKLIDFSSLFSIFHFNDKNNDKEKEDENSLIIETCHPNHSNCQTRSCLKDSNCFSNNCDLKTKKCLVNKDLPLYTCFNNNLNGGMICGKYLEEECIKDDDCITHHCDTQLHICKNFKEDFQKNNKTISISVIENQPKYIELMDSILQVKEEEEKIRISNNNNNNNENDNNDNDNDNDNDNNNNNNNNMEKQQEDKPKEDEGNHVKSSTLIKEGLILVFVIIPIIVITQYVKSTKTVKNIKNNRTNFEYKSVFVDNISNC